MRYLLPYLLSAVLLCQWLRCAAGQSGGWCPTGVQLLPNLTDLLSSTAYSYYGAADDECSSFFLTALSADPSAASPTVLLKADETLTVTLVNQQPIPSSLLAAGFRYVTGMEYFNLRLYAAITTTLPLSSFASSSSSSTFSSALHAPSSRHRGLRPNPLPAFNVSSGLAVLSPSNLTLLAWYPLSRPMSLQCVAVDYADSTLYASAALSVSSLLHFAIGADGHLSPLPDVPLVSQPPFAAILGSALLSPGWLLMYVSWPTPPQQHQQHQEDTVGAVNGSVLQYDVKARKWSSLLNASTALPVTSMADFWSTSQPQFGQMHLIDAGSMYNYDTC